MMIAIGFLLAAMMLAGWLIVFFPLLWIILVPAAVAGASLLWVGVRSLAEIQIEIFRRRASKIFCYVADRLPESSSICSCYGGGEMYVHLSDGLNAYNYAFPYRSYSDALRELWNMAESDAYFANPCDCKGDCPNKAMCPLIRKESKLRLAVALGS